MWWWTRRQLERAVSELQDLDSTVREDAYETVVKLGGDEAARMLLAALRQPEWKERHPEAWEGPHEVGDLIRAIVKLKRWSLEPLLEAVRSPHPHRCYTIEALGLIKDPRVVSPLLGLLNELTQQDGEPLEVEAIVNAAAGLGDPRVVPLLLKVIDRLANTQTAFRGIHLDAAVKSLTSLKDARAVPALVDLLPRAQDYNVQNSTLRALGEFGDGRAIPVLQAFLSGAIKPAGAPADSEWLRRSATEALANCQALPGAGGAAGK